MRQKKRVAEGNHEWVFYCNPRNNKIQIKACVKCGAAYGFGGKKIKCTERPVGKNRMTMAGWKQLVSRNQTT